MVYCDSRKSPGPDDINFCFVKDCLGEIKSDVMRFIFNISVHSKLVKGSNCTFIDLVPKVTCLRKLYNFDKSLLLDVCIR